jgi:hypothetical protein
MKKKLFFGIMFFLLFYNSYTFSAVYHIDPSSNTVGDGSAFSPFKSWANLPKMLTGDDVYFKCGTTFKPSSPTGYLRIYWEGNEKNPVVVGAYYIKGGTPVYGVSGDRPIISGNNYTTPDWSNFAGLITVFSKDYIVIKDLHLHESGKIGVYLTGDFTVENNASYFVVQNVWIDGANDSGILSNKNPYSYGVIENCEVKGANRGYRIGLANNWGMGIQVSNSPYSYTNIRRNYVHEGFGEGIGVFRSQNPSGLILDM